MLRIKIKNMKKNTYGNKSQLLKGRAADGKEGQEEQTKEE